MVVLDWLCKFTFAAVCVGAALMMIAFIVSGIHDLWMTNWRATTLCGFGIVTIAMATRGLVLFSKKDS
jgi:hypothetical protein